MPKIIAVIIEVLVCLFALWFTAFFSTLFHEFGHAVGYMLATGDRHWHIRVGWGKQLLDTKRLTVNLFVFDGFFTPEIKEFKTKARLIIMLLGGPLFTLLLLAGLSVLKFSGLSFQSGFFAESAVELFVNVAFSINLFLLIISVAPIRYFYGKTKGLASDGLKIIRVIRKHDD